MKTILLSIISVSLIGCTYSPTNIRNVSSAPTYVSDSPFVRVIPSYYRSDSYERSDSYDYIVPKTFYPDYPPYRKSTPPVYISY
jgi:hypothetical protein